MTELDHGRQMAGSQVRDAELRLGRTTPQDELRRWVEDPTTWVTDYREMIEAMEAAADRIDRLEALLREAIIWCPRKPKHPTSAKRQAVGNGWCDLGDRIEAALSGNVAETG